ncbi:MAG: 4-hydroxythreonine-4-phosphate dehydrogenase PdxA [Hyphomicrobiales bacterium]
MPPYPKLPAPLALTIGEPAGIGPELALKAWQISDKAAIKPFALIGDVEVMRTHSANLTVPIEQIDAFADAQSVFAKALPVFHIPFMEQPQLGAPSSKTASGVLGAIEKAVELTLSGEARAVVTNPIQKATLKQAGFAHPGHTEYLAALANKAGYAATPVMMLANEKLRAVPVTIHVALSSVPGLLTTELIINTARIAHRDLQSRFGIAQPRLAISGLNPHAGENGAFGDEDETIIAPAISHLCSEGINAFGPLPADMMFHDEARETYDVALCMYHDQALIPVKTLGFHDGVNVTLGLPFVRTSPDHGTALDLAGKGTARADSLIAALKLADRLTRHD